MATLTHKLNVFSDGSLVEEEQVVSLRKLYRQPHDLEIVDYDLPKIKGWVYRGDGVGGGPVRDRVVHNRVGLPEVYRLSPWQSFWITEPWKDLTCAMNPKLPRERALSVYLEGAFLCNTHDFLCDQARWCGGAFAEGENRDGIVYLKSLLITEPVPTVDYMNNHPELWYYGVTIVPNGTRRFVTEKGYDGLYYPVRIPFVLELPAYAPASWLDELPPDFDFADYDPRTTSPLGHLV